MATKYNSFEITALYMGEEFNVTIDGSTCSQADILENLKEQRKEQQDEDAPEAENIELSEEFEVTSWGDVPTWAQDFDILADLMPEYEGSYYEIEVFEAAHDCDIQFSDVDEAYAGSFDSNEKFAEDFAEQTGALDRRVGQNWPYTCIDWEQAARELMYDYCEANGYYFRNL